LHYLDILYALDVTKLLKNLRVSTQEVDIEASYPACPTTCKTENSIDRLVNVFACNSRLHRELYFATPGKREALCLNISFRHFVSPFLNGTMERLENTCLRVISHCLIYAPKGSFWVLEL